MRRQRFISGIMSAILIFTMCSGCSIATSSKSNKNIQLDTSKNVHLVIAGTAKENKALDILANQFREEYPNCTIEYECIQDFNNMLPKRLLEEPDSVDLFLTNKIQEDSPFYPYAYDITSENKIDLSNSFEGLVENFTIKSSEDNSSHLYAIPLGGEVRGMYVNTTLLDTLGLSVPTTRSELLEDCKVLSEKGYIPLQNNPGCFSQQLLYPYVANSVTNADNYEEIYQKTNNREPGISEQFRDSMQFMYDLVKNNYYNYKYIEQTDEAFLGFDANEVARSFLNIVPDGDDYKKIDDVGKVAFMPSTMSEGTTIDRFKEDYGSNIEYTFILSPVTEEGGYAYLSPASAIAINKQSENLDWTIAFLNYLLEIDNNTQFAQEANILPNTKYALNMIKKTFDIPDNRISHLGQMTFDYDFYSIYTTSLMAVSKANNPKYMNTDDDGNPVMYDFEYYMEEFEKALQEGK